MHQPASRLEAESATGEILLEFRGGGQYRCAGHTIAVAARLEQAADPGGMLLDSKAFAEEDFEPFRGAYGPREKIPGKQDGEYYDAHRYPHPTRPEEPPTAMATEG